MRKPLALTLVELLLALAVGTSSRSPMDFNDIVLGEIPLIEVEDDILPELTLDSLDVTFGIYERWTGDLQEIIKRRKVRILVPYSKNFFVLEGSEGKGLIYESTQMLEAFLRKKTGKRVSVILIPVRRDQIIPALQEGIGDLIAANLTITPNRMAAIDFSIPIYEDASEWIVTGPKSPTLESIEDLSGKEVHVRYSSSFYEHLQEINVQFEEKGLQPIDIYPVSEYLEDEHVLELVNNGLIPTTVIGDNIGLFWAQMMDSLNVRRDLVVADSCNIAWAVRKGNSDLLAFLNTFAKQHRKGTMMGNILFKRYLKDTARVKSISPDALARFNSTMAHFQKYAHQYGFDWMMMAAQGYQESGLDQEARSRAGAVGIMQVLPSTAREPYINIPNIQEAEDNIHAGIKYMNFMYNRYFMDDEMGPLNKHLFVFAAYNAGPARIRQLQQIAKAQGLNPNVWFNQVERVAAAEIGAEPVQYVSNIYKYYLSLRYLNKYMTGRRNELFTFVDAKLSKRIGEESFN